MKDLVLNRRAFFRLAGAVGVTTALPSMREPVPYFHPPVGMVLQWIGSEDVPEGTMVADGHALRIAEYQELFEVLGRTYGGDQSTFNLPDLRGRVLIGRPDGPKEGPYIGVKPLIIVEPTKVSMTV